MNTSNFQFTDPSLIYIRFIENTGFNVENEGEIPIETKIKLKNNKLSDNEYIVNAVVTIGKEDSTCPFYIETEISAKFKWEEAIADKTQEKLFLKQNAPALLISYLRPIVAMITNASHYPAYNLPFINFAE